MLLSILIPVYNERTVVEKSLALVLAAPLPENMDRELVIVDDCSADGTSDILARLAAGEPRIRLFRQSVNQGKGAAVRRAIQEAVGDFCLVQDADLEYDPSEYGILLRPLLDGRADAVFGSRYLAGEQSRVLPFWHSMLNKGLTTVSNMFSNLNVTDMETCYKVFRTDLLKSIPIRSDRFGFEPEITMKVSKRKLRVYEVPISYHGRTYEEGKKIGWKDGAKALGVILYFWIIDDLYAESYGRGLLNSLTGTPQYLSWITRLLRPNLGDTVLEIGAGLGNLTGRLMGKKIQYVAAEKDPLYLHALRNRFLRTPSVTVCELDPDGDVAGVPPMGLAIRERAVRQRARIRGESPKRAPLALRLSETRRCAGSLGSTGPAIVQLARPRNGTQAAVQGQRTALDARGLRIAGGQRASTQQDRRALMVGLRQAAATFADQPACAEVVG